MATVGAGFARYRSFQCFAASSSRRAAALKARRDRQAAHSDRVSGRRQLADAALN